MANSAQTSTKIGVIVLLKRLDIEQLWEKHSKGLLELITVWHFIVCQNLVQISHVRATMKANPSQSVVEE
jgi:hypothetical protein